MTRPPRSRFRSTVDWLLVLSVLSTPAVAQTPIPDAGKRGVPRQLLTTRDETQLLSVLDAAGRRTYKVYSFEFGGRFDHARATTWNGLMLLPSAAELGPARRVGVPAPDRDKSIETVYQHPDGTMSKLVVDPAGRTIGVVSVRGISAWAQLDIDRDGIVDWLRIVSLDGHETIAASVPNGAAFLERWRLGDMQLCSPRDVASLPGVSDRSKERGEPGLPGTTPSIPLCGESQSERGALSGIMPTKSPERADPMDRICAGRSGSATLPGSGGPRADKDPAAVAQGMVTTVVWKMMLKEPGEVRPPCETGCDRPAGGAPSGGAPPGGAPGSPPGGTPGSPSGGPPGGVRNIPVPGSEGVRGGESEATLNAMCAQRARANRRWTVTLSALEKNQTGATDTNCDDPVTDPAAADAQKSAPKCGPSRESQSVSQQLLAGLGAYESRQCGRLEQPGPDGTCRGGRTIGSNRARLWYGWGNVIGLIPCDGIACDPKENP
jgi:hypothetical protein